MTFVAVLMVLFFTACICIPALYWILREAREDKGTLIDDEDVLY